MRPTLRQLQYLVAVAETGHFGEAAKRVHISQPSLSAQIADMELEVGTSLFERGRHGAYLTPKGEEAVRRAKLILRDVEDLKAAARSSSDNLEGRLRLGVLPTIGPYLLPPAARRLHGNYPDLRFSVKEERPMDLETHLQEGQFDTVISTADDHADCKSMQLFDDNLWICVAHDDPLATTRAPVKPKDLKGRELLSLGYSSWHSLDLRVHAIAQKAGATVSSEYQGTTLDAVRQMAEMGAGVAVLPSMYALIEVRRDPHLIVRRIDHPIAVRTISLVWRNTSPLDANFRILATVFREVAEEIIGAKVPGEIPSS